MWQLFSTVFLILSYLGVISVGCLLAGVVAMFDGSPAWFGLSAISLGILGLFCTNYHLKLAIEAYRNIKDMK